MVAEIMHEGRFGDPSLGWCPLVTDLVGTNLADKIDRKALQNSHFDAGEGHMHFNSTDSFQNFST